MNKFEEAVCRLSYQFNNDKIRFAMDYENNDLVNQFIDDLDTWKALEKAIRLGYARIDIDYTGGEDHG